MTHPGVLSISQAERGAMARELRRYREYRLNLANDLLDAHVIREPDEPEPPGITTQIGDMANSHFLVAGACDALAERFEGDGAVELTRDVLYLIDTVLDNAYAGDLPGELTRVAEFGASVRLQLRRPAGADRARGRFLVVNAETPPPSLPQTAGRSGGYDPETAPASTGALPAGPRRRRRCRSGRGDGASRRHAWAERVAYLQDPEGTMLLVIQNQDRNRQGSASPRSIRIAGRAGGSAGGRAYASG